MGKYKFYKNKRTQYHPSIEVKRYSDGSWDAIDLTESPAGYGYFKTNPNPNDNKISFYKKRINHYEKGQKGEELTKFRLTAEDEKIIDDLINEYNKIKKDEAIKASSVGAKPRPIIGGVANHRNSGQSPLSKFKQKTKNKSRRKKAT